MELSADVRLELRDQANGGLVVKQQKNGHVELRQLASSSKWQLRLAMKSGQKVVLPLKAPAWIHHSNLKDGRLTVKLGNVGPSKSTVQLLLCQGCPHELAAFGTKVGFILSGGKSKTLRVPLQPVTPNGGGSPSPLKRGAAAMQGCADISLQNLSPEQADALKQIRSGKSIFVTGSAGTGKSLLLRHILSVLPKSSTFFTASTGLAACQLGGTTLHSFAGLGRMEGEIESLVQRASRPEPRRKWCQCRVLIIDEISMVDGDTFDKLELVARKVRGVSKPFGGIQLVLVGDFHQLPPVAKARKFCFQSSTWEQCISSCIVLSKVYRQVDNTFVEWLEVIRQGRADADLLRSLCHRCSDPLDTSDGIEATKLQTHRADCDQQNTERLSALAGDMVTYCAVDEGVGTLVEQLRNNCPARATLDLKNGAQVMLIQTIAPGRGLVNGTRGVITGFRGLQKMPVVLFTTGEELMVGREKWSISGGAGQASRKQVPLALAWAVSVHKSQGMTLDKVEVSLDKAFEFGMAYVALSRVRSLEGLRITGSIAPKALKADPKVTDFYSQNKTKAT